MSTEWIKHFQN